MGPPWMLVRLALETTVHHQQADDDRLTAIDVNTLDAYRAFLRRVFSFEAAVETAIAAAGIEPMFTNGRFKAELIRSDLFELGCEPPMIATVNVRSTAHAMGWLFVIERHTLLAGLIRRHIQRTLETSAVGYLSAYDDAPGIRFRGLGDALGVYAQRHSPRSIISGANEAFRAQRQWYTNDSPGDVVVEPHDTAESL